MKKKRLGDVLSEKGLVKDKNDAFIVITEGRVFVNGRKAVSPAELVTDADKIEARHIREYVGRGAYKLEAALKKFAVDVRGKVCADIGSAVGGFVEVLLKYGAKRVYAIDTARGKLDLKLREDPRVVVVEGRDIRGLSELGEPAALATADVSLISLREILPKIRRFLTEEGEIIALFKPQYETRDPKILRHGVVKDDAARRHLLYDFIKWAETNGWKVTERIESPILGGEGNVEYLLYLKQQ